MPFEVLNLSFVFFRRPTRCEGPKISPLSGFGVLLLRVQAVLTCFEFPDHLEVLLWIFNRPTGCLCKRGIHGFKSTSVVHGVVDYDGFGPHSSRERVAD